MNLYGSDMDETVTPLESNMAWTVAWQPESRQFLGRDALETQQANGVPSRLVGVVLKEKGILRAHQQIRFANGTVGELTSGTFSPLWGTRSAGENSADASGDALVDIRNKQFSVELVNAPFVRNGKQVYTPLFN